MSDTTMGILHALNSGRWTLDEILRINRATGQHWFDDDTLHFWGTQLYGDATVFPAVRSQKRVYFVSSEYGPFRDMTTRLFSVRYLDENGHVQTLHFQQFTTLAQAVRVARRASQGLSDCPQEDN